MKPALRTQICRPRLRQYVEVQTTVLADTVSGRLGGLVCVRISGQKAWISLIPRSRDRLEIQFRRAVTTNFQQFATSNR